MAKIGRIDHTMLAVSMSMSPIYFLAGPPGMVKDLHQMLKFADVSEDDIRMEEFSGY